MNVVYTLQDAPETLTSAIFLAGPTPRDPDTPSWRPEALAALERAGYDGVVFVPEYEGEWAEDYEYSEQVEWEEKYLNMADVILFWVPRDIEGGLPAFTTNIEWGKWQYTGKCVLGFPEGADKMRYLAADAEREGVPTADTVEGTILAALYMIGEGAERTGGERDVPVHIWRTESFQSWYKAQVGAGNRIDGAKALWTFNVGPKKDIVFYWAIHMDVWIAIEDRNKTNEVVLSRPDISTIVAYNRGPGVFVEWPNVSTETEVVIVREFRSPASTIDGFVREVPGGSSHKEGVHPLARASDEFREETGFGIEPGRFRYLGARQLTATLSAHQAHLFAVELDLEEIEALKSQAGVAHGVEEDSERTYVEVHRLGNLLETGLVDWSNMGMILTAVLG
jgi:hypothetical protein